MQCVQSHAEATSIRIKIKNKTASYGLQNEKLRLFIFLISSQMQCLTTDLQRGVLLSLYIPQVQTGTEHPAPSRPLLGLQFVHPMQEQTQKHSWD